MSFRTVVFACLVFAVCRMMKGGQAVLKKVPGPTTQMVEVKPAAAITPMKVSVTYAKFGETANAVWVFLEISKSDTPGRQHSCFASSSKVTSTDKTFFIPRKLFLKHFGDKKITLDLSDKDKVLHQDVTPEMSAAVKTKPHAVVDKCELEIGQVVLPDGTTGKAQIISFRKMDLLKARNNRMLSEATRGRPQSTTPSETGTHP